MTPAESRKQAHDAALTGGKNELAKKLKEYYGFLQSAYPNAKDYPEKETKAYDAMADELVSKGTLTLENKDGTKSTYTLDDLDKKDTEKGGLLKKSLGVDHVGDILYPIKKIPEAVGKAAEEHTGTIGFLGGATIGNALMGLFQWIFSGFDGGFDGLKKMIAQATADSMREQTKHNLEKLRANDPKMQRFLDGKTISGISNKVHEAVIRTAKGEKEPVDNSLAETRQKTLNERDIDLARRQIYTEILHPKEGDKLEDAIAKTYSAEVQAKRDEATVMGIPVPGFIANRSGPSEEEIKASSKKMAETIADTVSTTVTDPNYRYKGQKLSDLSKEEYANAVASETGKALKAKEAEFGLAFKFDDKDEKTGKTALDGITDKVREKVAENYEQLAMVSNAADKTARQVAERKARKEVDTSVATHSPTPQPLVPGEDLGRANTPAGGKTAPDGPQLA